MRSFLSHVGHLLGRTGAYIFEPTEQGKSIHTLKEAMVTLCRSCLSRGNPEREEFTPHTPDAGGWGEAIEPEKVNFLKVVTILDCYDGYSTVTGHAVPEIMAIFVHP